MAYGRYFGSGYGGGGRRRVTCYHCGGPHLRPECPRLKRRSSNGGSGSKRASKKAKRCPWEEMKKPELVAECKRRGLPHQGLKGALVERLKEDVVSGASRNRAIAAAAAAAPPAGGNDDVCALFEVEDEDENDAALLAIQIPEAKTSVPGDDRKPAANANGTRHGRGEIVITATKPSKDSKLGLSLVLGEDGTGVKVKAVNPTSLFANTELKAGMVVKKVNGVKFSTMKEAVGLFKQAEGQISIVVSLPEGTKSASVPATAPSRSQSSQTSVTSPTADMSLSQTSASSDTKREITEEQRARMKLMKEEALKKRMARSSNGSVKSESMSQSPTASQGSWQPKPGGTPVNPYSKTKKKEEVPDGLPPVREETLNKLSDEQLEVIMTARPPTVLEEKSASENDTMPWMSRGVKPHMVRVNAAAGTGKTTTLLHLAIRCIDLGHESLNYVTFARAAANDCKERIQALLEEEQKSRVHASTMHSCAMNLLQNEPLESEDVEPNKRIYDDHAFQTLIRQHWGRQLEEFVQPAVDHVELGAKTDDAKRKLGTRVKLLHDKALYYLWKSFRSFCQSKKSVEELNDRNNSKRHYFPVTKDFAEGDKAQRLGFPSSIYHQPCKYSFFADTVAQIWDYIIKNGVRSFDIELKRAQLKQLRIPCSLLLVDESQDMDECQVDWLAGQRKFGTHIYFVGDSAQTIYGFRGAKSSNVMKLDCVDTQLTKSWRFGPSIAKVANIPLFAKEFSPQTTSEQRKYGPLWKPYRVQGAQVKGESSVVTRSLVENWRDYKPLTLIGATNAALMSRAMDMLGLSGLKNPEGPAEGGEAPSDDENGASVNNTVTIDIENIPRFHINGKGESSGFKKWSKSTKEIRHLYKLYSNRDESGFIPMELPATLFPEFANDSITWTDFGMICETREITKYVASAQIVTAYKQNTLEALDKFESHVMAEKYSEDEADIILTTGHASKGLEWDHVEICPDLLDLHAASFAASLKSAFRHPSFMCAMPGETTSSLQLPRATKRDGWEFVMSSYEDSHINLLYVAMTRARITLCVPESIKSLLQQFDLLHFLVESFVDAAIDGKTTTPTPDDESLMVLKDRKLTKGQVWNLYHDIVVPLRKELGLSDDSTILPALFPDCEGETEIKDQPEEPEQEMQRDTATSGDGSVAALFDS